LGQLFDLDERRLLSADEASGRGSSRGAAASMWDLETGREIQRFEGHTERIRAVAFSPDGKQVLTGAGRGGDLSFRSSDNSARLWDVATGKEVRRFVGHTGYVHTVQFSPNGVWVLTAARDSTARVWERASGRELFLFSGLDYVAHVSPMVAFSPDGREIVGLLAGGHGIRVWRAATGKELYTIGRDRGFFDSVEFSPDARLLLTASSAGTAGTWDTSTGTQVEAFTGHANSVQQAAFAANGQIVITASADHSVRLWDADTGREMKRFEHPGPVSMFVTSRSGKRLIARWTIETKGSVSHCASLWDVDSGREITRLTTDVEGIVGFALTDEKLLVTHAGKPAALYDGASGEIVRRYK